MKRLMALILFCSTMTACIHPVARINTAMASWESHSVTDLLAKWGPPQQVLSDGEYQVYMYITTSTSYTAPVTYRLWRNKNASTVVLANGRVDTSIKSWRMFWADKNGIIRRWSWKGL